jgi:hypothetical protein
LSDENDERELLALQRQLDDAFATTRPRRGFEDEVWARLQEARPVGNRLRDALASLGAGLRPVRVPAGVVAAIVIVGLTVGILLQAGGHLGGGSTASTNFNGGARAPQDYANAGFGKLPSPSFTPGKAATVGPNPPEAVEGAVAVHYTWAGTATFTAVSAPVYRYQEPSAASADQFAAGLGGVLRDRPAGFLGSYSAATYTLKVRGTVQSPPSSPAYFIFSSTAMPALDTSGVGVDGAATNFLAAHRLSPDWPYAVMFTTSGDPIRVVYQRQFSVPGYGLAYLVDGNGDRYGVEVDLSANRPILVSGLLPLPLDSAQYDIVSPGQALGPTLAAPAAAGAPTATLTHGELVYVLVPAGRQSYYEPAYLFTGTMQDRGATVAVRLLAPAVDPSQRTP